MGCIHSNPSVLPSGVISRQFHTEKQRKRAQKNMEARMQTALKLIVDHKRVESDAERIDASFNRIILKFPVIRHAFTSIREVFKRFDTDGNGTIDPLELRTCLSALGALLTDTDVEEMFEFAKMTEKGYLTFKEFLLCLAVGTVLQLFPLLKAYEGVDMLQASGRLSVHTASTAAAATASTVRSARGSHRLGRASSHGTAAPDTTPSVSDATTPLADGGAERPPTPFQTARLRAASAAAAAAAEPEGGPPAAEAAAVAATAALKSRSSHSRRRSSASVVPAPPEVLVATSSLSQVDVQALGQQQQQQLQQKPAAAAGAARPPPIDTAPVESGPLPLLGADGKGWGQTRPAPPGVPAISMPVAAAPVAGGRTGSAAAPTRPAARTSLPGASPPAPGGAGEGGSGGGGTSAFKRSAVFAHGQRLVKALRLVLEAYVLFDRDGSGTIDRDEVLSMIDESAKGAGGRGSGAGGNALLSRERWMELDWDGDGQITFKEFLYAFMQWVGVEDDEGDELDGAPEVAMPVELLVAQQMHAQLPTGGGHTTPKAASGGGASPRLAGATTPKHTGEARVPSLRSVTPSHEGSAAAGGGTRAHSLKSDASSRSGDGRSPSQRAVLQRSPSHRSRSPAAVAPATAASGSASARPVSGRVSGFATGRSANAEDAAAAAAAAAAGGSHPPTLLHQLSASHVLAAPNHAHHVPVKSSLTASSREAIQAVTVAAHAAAVALQQQQQQQQGSEGAGDAASAGAAAGTGPGASTPVTLPVDGTCAPAPLQSYLMASSSSRHIDPADVDRLLELPQKGTAATAAKLVAQASMRQLALEQQQQQQQQQQVHHDQHGPGPAEHASGTGTERKGED